MTHRRKRNLLVETTAAIEQREEFAAELDDERVALETFTEELADVEEALEKLPVCSAQEQHIDTILVIWGEYDTLLGQCDRLLDRRQQQIREAERSLRIFRKKHARNEFLYSELDTKYPVLSAIATTCERIDARRNGEWPLERSDWSLQH